MCKVHYKDSLFNLDPAIHGHKEYFFSLIDWNLENFLLRYNSSKWFFYLVQMLYVRSSRKFLNLSWSRKKTWSPLAFFKMICWNFKNRLLELKVQMICYIVVVHTKILLNLQMPQFSTTVKMKTLISTFYFLLH